MSDESRLISLPLARSTDVGPVGYEFRQFGAAPPTTEYKMRGRDDGRPAPGYVSWKAKFQDFAGTQVSGAVPPLLGSLISNSVSVVGSWNV